MSTPHAEKAVRKYLKRHAEDSARRGTTLGQPFKRVVVITAYGEDQVLDRAIDSIPGDASDPTLAVDVIDERNNSPAMIKRVNDATSNR